MNAKMFLAVSITCAILAACGQRPAQNSEKQDNSESKTAVAEPKAELEIISFAGRELPSGMKHEGNVLNVIHYSDAMGDNYVFTAGRDFTSKDETLSDYDLYNSELYVYHYVTGEDGSTKQIWRIFDNSYECMDNTSVEIPDNSFNVTDLDKDGMAETWVLYKKTGCATDCCFPQEMKVIMYEGEQKYAMRGTDKVEQITEYEGGRKVTTSEGGDYKFDAAFHNANAEFQDYAKKMWNDNIIGITMQF